MPAILFSSPKGGVGKTTIATHVAAIMAKRGHHVVALDLDPQNALRLHFGLPFSDEPGFITRLRLHADWHSSLVQTRYGVELLPYGCTAPVDAIRLHAAILKEPELLTEPIRAILDDPRTILIVDSPPGPSPAVTALASLAELVVVVLLADAGSACLLPQLLSGRTFGNGTIGGRAMKRAGFVLNQVELNRRLSLAVLDSATRVLGSKLLGAVCRDERIAEDLAQARLQIGGDDGAAPDLAILVDAIEARLPVTEPAARPASYPALVQWGMA